MSQPGLTNESVGDQEDYLSLEDPSSGFHFGDLIWILAIATATAAILAAAYLYI